MKALEPIVTRGGLRLLAETRAAGDQVEISLQASTPITGSLHWGIRAPRQKDWTLPPQAQWPAGTQQVGPGALQTPLPSEAGLRIVLDRPPAGSCLAFVLYFPDGNRWDNNGGKNYEIPLSDPTTGGEESRRHGAGPPAAGGGLGQLSGMADEIIRAETTHNSWTLMHRFNLCHDLLERVRQEPEGQALLYVWLRFSALRQLTWQRNYNTKPRELAHAQDRLTQQLAELYRSVPAARPWTRLMLATVGRGGEGQRIRDEILNIMHRHHLKEVSGHFLEEWHQKLHNNTTPDDVVICEAYLEFLRSEGRRDRFYQVLQEGGVTRQRLESFERPIRTEPDFVPHLKGGLIHDFENFLRILKASHSGTDLETAINAARGQLEGGLQNLLGDLWAHRHEPAAGLLHLVGLITKARRRLSPVLRQGNGLRELLYLDLALEQSLRNAVERNLHENLSGEQWAQLIARILENATFGSDDPELAICARHWERLQSAPGFSAEWSLHAKSVADRIGRALSAWTDRCYQMLQPKAERLGSGFQAEPWTITLFSEEVVRGSSLAFVLSALLHHLDPILRQAAHLGNWQIISRGHGGGRVEVVAALRSIQQQRFPDPTVVVADQVMGDEEIPEGVTAVIAPDVTDIVSHVAVRARNAGILFAACHDPALLQHLKSLQGRYVRLEVTPAGDVVASEPPAEAPAPQQRQHGGAITIPVRSFTKYAVTLEEFDHQTVGGKSFHQARLRSQLPGWIHLPSSMAVPFGVLKKVLSHETNQAAARHYQELLGQAGEHGTGALAKLRETVLSLVPPPEMKDALREVMTRAGLPWPDDWERMWHSITRVWASTWNERAFLSRQKVGMPHERLEMAVLVQTVVEADYAFVIHTVNPVTGRTNELLAEVVLGLGETLVGNYPGRALTFVFDKTTGQANLLSYPGKSVALYGSGLIFRSDSNGEDLAGYAGAGLYDSVLLRAPRQVTVDYTQEPLVWDEGFRHNLLTSVARLGLEVERLSGTPQDIEGAVVQGTYYVVQTRPQVGLT